MSSATHQTQMVGPICLTRRQKLTAAAIFLFAATLTCVFFINFCDFIFQCGCRSLWAGAEMACNLHSAHGKHCPWCNHRIFSYAVLALMLIPQFAISIQTNRNPWMRLAVAVLAFPLVGGIGALAAGIWDGYWSA